MLVYWLQCISRLPNTIKKCYYPGAFLRDVTSDPLAEDLYQKVIKAVTSLQKEIPSVFYPQEPNQSDSLQDTNLISTFTAKYACMHT